MWLGFSLKIKKIKKKDDPCQFSGLVRQEGDGRGKLLFLGFSELGDWTLQGNAFPRQPAICAGVQRTPGARYHNAVLYYPDPALECHSHEVPAPSAPVGLQAAPTLELIPLRLGQRREQKPRSGSACSPGPFLQSPSPLPRQFAVPSACYSGLPVLGQVSGQGKN
jgi:hypothetical protein